MKKMRKFGSAFVLAAVMAGILGSSTPAYAVEKGYCKRLQSILQSTADGTPLHELAEYLYATYCA